VAITISPIHTGLRHTGGVKDWQGAHFSSEPPLINQSNGVKGVTTMKRISFFTVLLAITLVISIHPAIAGSVDVSGYTDEGVYVQGELDISSGGSVDGYVTTDGGKDIYIEGELESGGSVSVDSDSWDGGGYDLDVD
jgi:hypothetical protein